ncbi:MAG: HK97 gp10 family phage protein [Oscillospiraceae bacterium]|nr:HK97 gp10 family phage protein [Oscillospiraceae bacterium]
MAGISISINGLDDALGLMDEVIADVQSKLPQAIAEAGKTVEGAAKDLCPVRSGTLHDSINSEASGNTAVIGTNVEYAGYVEFGTCKMAAKPYLIRALVDNEDAIIEKIKAAVL